MTLRMGVIRGSSLIKAVGFSGGPGDVGTLRIRFYDAEIDFSGVPYSVFRGLVVAKDKSAHYLKHIYGAYKYQKL